MSAAPMSRMVSFELRWYSHGGGPEETILADFGMSPTEFFRELHTNLELDPPDTTATETGRDDEGRRSPTPLGRLLTTPYRSAPAPPTTRCPEEIPPPEKDLPRR
ncbi:DUF3263 domain-containing protein [Rhodococcus sp. ACS1]|uniref:DUF3263 domain-containing protein n=1 Tax=Rhodococcus sp. ACS1 TaxID=2028570 RepID=UPI00211BBA22|nr:DUF3263 domain-containing protein [Rhodococcus sp. ACS1]